MGANNVALGTAPLNGTGAFRVCCLLLRLAAAKRFQQPELHRLLRALGPKAGIVLFQLPPQFAKNAERLASFLPMLPPRRRYFDNDQKAAAPADARRLIALLDRQA